MKAPKTVTLDKLFTAAELARALKIIRAHAKTGKPVNSALVSEVVEPALARINETTGQENDARYLGYMLEAVIR